MNGSAVLSQILGDEMAAVYAKAKPLRTLPSGPECARLRQQAGVRREEVAVLSGATYETLRTWEQGHRAQSYILMRSEPYRRFLAACQALAATNPVTT